ncbi:type I restriction-modification system subunit M/S [Micromonospora nigra]|uniref:N-6 DNA methylase n=1 Tax=Micromonospora nigra TaxID=145857 RepID=UPI0015868F39|nr:type I restriction-modification system subunit M/S [Micromonospora nigra]
MAGVSRASVTQWGKRHADFPRPGDDKRFALADVLRWLESRQAVTRTRDAGTRVDRYADRVRRNLAAAAPVEPPNLQLPGDGRTAQADNLTLRLALILLRTRDPQAWAEVDRLIPPDLTAVGARWLLKQIAAAVARTARRDGVRPEVFAALQRLAPERVSQVRGIMARCAGLGAADVQAIADEYETALPSGSFLTPRAVATLLAEALIDGTAESIYDPYLRGGELLAAAAAAAPNKVSLYGRGAQPAALSLSGVTLLARGETADLRAAEQDFPPPVTHILANPPFGGDSWIDQLPDTQWRPFPAPPARSAFRWLLHCLQRLCNGGRIAIIMPPTAATSANTRESGIRRQLIEQSMVEAVIALPSGLYAGSHIATSIWIVRHPPGSDQPILFIDATHPRTPDDRPATLDEARHTDILQAWRSFLIDRDARRSHPGSERFSVAIPKTDIRTDTCSLNPAEYVRRRIESPPAGRHDTRTDLHQLYQRSFDCQLAADEATALLSEPSGARTVNIGEYCAVKTGYSYSRLPAKDRSDHGVPIVLPRHLRDGRIVADDPPYAPHHLAASLVDYEVRTGDVLCVRTGALTPPALARPADDGRLVSTNLLRLRVHDTDVLDPYFLYAYLRLVTQTKMTTFARSTATAYVAAAHIAQTKIPLPPPHQQQAIVAALRALDDEVTAARALAVEATSARDAINRRLLGGA